MKLKFSRNQIYVILLSALVFVAFYAMNHWAFLVADDYTYTLIYGNDRFPVYGSERIVTVWDCLVSQYNHYFVWNGRVIVHTVVQFFCGIAGRGYFNWINSIVFLLFICGIARLANVERKLKPSTFFLSFLFIWFLMPSIADTMIWVSGSVNYLWVTTVFLYFFLYFERFRQEKYSLWVLPLFTIGGLLLGWTHEIAALSVAGSCFLFYLLYHQKPTRQEWFFIMGFLLGLIGLCFAPGNWTRVEATGFSLSRLLMQIVMVVHRLMVVFPVLIVLLYGVVRRKQWTKELLKREGLLVGAMVISFVISVSLQQELVRVFFFSNVLALIILVRWFENLLIGRTEWLRKGVFGICFFSFICSFFIHYSEVRNRWEVNEAYYQSLEKNEGVMISEKEMLEWSRFGVAVILPEFAFGSYSSYRNWDRIKFQPKGLYTLIAPIDVFCVEQNQLFSGKPIYYDSRFPYFVVKLPKATKEELPYSCVYKRNSRWDRDLFIQLGLMEETKKVIPLPHYFYDYSDGEYWYYFLPYPKDVKDRLIDIELLNVKNRI